jgi:cytidine deaminase
MEQLIQKAQEAQAQAYAPYSKFKVGAALQTSSGRIFMGCNVENLSFGLTICAERAAVFAAVSAGHSDFTRIVIATDSAVPASPCGACRQVLAEFNPEMEIISCTRQGDRFTARLDELLPRAKDGIL